jgi:hypothetical protein
VLDIGDHNYVKLWGRRPRLADVDAQGHLYDQVGLGARQASSVRALACWRGGRTVAAWTEYRGDHVDALQVGLRPGVATTVDVVRGQYYEPGIGDVALAFTPDGELLIVYSVFHEVRAVTVSASDVSEPVTLGPASEATQVEAESSLSGRTVVAWATIDAGEERNERRRIYAVTGHDGRFGRARLVDRARHVNIAASTTVPIRHDLAPNGRALLLWGADRADPDNTVDPSSEDYLVRVAEASPHGWFGTPRQLSSDGYPGDVAVQSDGTALAVWRTSDGLRASVHEGGRRFRTHEVVTDKRVGEPGALFDRGHPRVEWGDGFSERERP